MSDGAEVKLERLLEPFTTGKLKLKPYCDGSYGDTVL